MKTAAILSLVISTVAAFAPQQDARASTSLASSFESELGAQKPLGFWYVCRSVARQSSTRWPI